MILELRLSEIELWEFRDQKIGRQVEVTDCEHVQLWTGIVALFMRDKVSIGQSEKMCDD